MSQKIRTRPDRNRLAPPSLEIAGWLSGAGSYLWFGDADGRCVGTLSGQKLYRLAKAIVRQFEEERARKAGAVAIPRRSGKR